MKGVMNMSENRPVYKTSAVAEMTDGIVLARFEKDSQVKETAYQSEESLEKRLIENLALQGYERSNIKTTDELYANLKVQMERLNKVKFTPQEWDRFLSEYLDSLNDGIEERTRKIQENYVHDFVFDDGHLENIKIIDKKNINNNFLQVVNQIKAGKNDCNRYDVTILVNGLPLVHIELKKRGVNLSEAFNQIHRYRKESFNDIKSLYKYVQIFVISNGTYTRYFANTTLTGQCNYEFTCEWADAKNRVISDLEDFTQTFFERRVLLEILTKYCVFSADNKLLIMRPYQIAATERILWKIKSSYIAKKAGTTSAGGYVWHTTGSGKTLTSFKTARLATELEYIDKVFFVVDRKDLDYQTMKEYQKFSKDSVNGSKDIHELRKNVEKEDNRIVVTTIQKLNEFIKRTPGHPIYDKHCVLIFDECHRSQFGEAQKNIQRSFKNYYQFGFTGTPIFVENSMIGETTAGVFGAQLHSYVITDAIRDKKVLKFKVDYNNTTPKYKAAEEETDDAILAGLEKDILLHPERIKSVTEHILKVFNTKTHRNMIVDIQKRRKEGFNAMFAVGNITAAKMYYDEFKRQQAHLDEDKKLRVAVIYSFVPNEEQNVVGEISEESLEVSAMNATGKEFLEKAINDYNECFRTNFSVSNKDFENYYKDLSRKVKDREVDLLIVVGMFLTGFDAPSLNTLFVDKNLRYHGLIQAFSRTNRIFNKVKTFGNIVCFRDLEKLTQDAIRLFGDENSVKIILERSYRDYMDGFRDEDTGNFVPGYKEICEAVKERFPAPSQIVLEEEKKDFIELFGDLLKLENILKNYDEFAEFEPIISEREMQDMKSAYIEIREEFLKQAQMDPKTLPPELQAVDISDIEFQIDLLKVDEINLDYIVALILDKSKESDDIEHVKDEIRRIVKSSVDIRAKENLIMKFMSITDFSKIKTADDIFKIFYEFAKAEKEKAIQNLIDEESLKEESRHFIERSIKNGVVEHFGDELDRVITKVSRIGGARAKKKEEVLKKLQEIVDIFSEV